MVDHFDARAQWQAERYRIRVYRHLKNGAIAGLLGGALIMVYVWAHDLLFFGTLATPGFLSELLPGRQALNEGLTARLRGMRIGMFAAMHMAVFTVLGIVLASLFRATGTRMKVLIGGIYGATLLTLVLAGGVHLAGAELLLGWSSLLLGNFLAGVAMGAYLELSKLAHDLEDLGRQ